MPVFHEINEEKEVLLKEKWFFPELTPVFYVWSKQKHN